jgi:GntR family transcriptional regulator, rspAB operon transcriptional repressor
MNDHLPGRTNVSAALRIAPVSGQGSASTRLYGDLRERIVRLELPPDTTLDRSELADTYQVSQSPVREAILRLEQDGLVQSFPQSRTEVTRIDVSRIHEEHFLRVAVESEVVRRLAESGSAATITKIKGLLRLQEALVNDVEQADLFKQLDEAFHEALFEGVGQLNLHRHIVARSGHMARVRTLDLPKMGKMRAVLEGHQLIVDAIAAADGQAATASMRRHLSGTIERLPALRAEKPEYFS